MHRWLHAAHRTLRRIKGRPQRCDWVRSRLHAFWAFDLPPRDFAAVEGHIGRCPDCAAEAAELERISAILQGFYEQRLGLSPSSAVAECVLAAIDARQAPKRPSGSTVLPSLARLRPALAACMALLVLVGGSVLGYAGYRTLSPEGGSEGFVPPAAPRIDTALFTAQPRPLDGTCDKPAFEPPKRQAPGPSSGAGTTVQDALNNLSGKEFARLQVEAAVPRTEDEYESWARREYPHIMWLRDILANPAQGAAYREGRPTKADIAASGDHTRPKADANELAGGSENLPTWQPGDIELLRNMHPVPGREESAFTEVSLAWRKLLIDSGELFKFDYPDSPERPACVPSIEGLRRAAAVAGYDLILTEEGTWPLPQLDYAEGELAATAIDLPATHLSPGFVPANPPMPADYLITLSRNAALAESVLNYLCISVRLADIPLLEPLCLRARDARMTLANAKDRIPCDTAEWAQQLLDVFQVRGEALASLNVRR